MYSITTKFIQAFLKNDEIDFDPDAALAIALDLLDTFTSAATFFADGFTSSSSSLEMDRFKGLEEWLTFCDLTGASAFNSMPSLLSSCWPRSSDI